MIDTLILYYYILGNFIDAILPIFVDAALITFVDTLPAAF